MRERRARERVGGREGEYKGKARRGNRRRNGKKVVGFSTSK